MPSGERDPFYRLKLLLQESRSQRIRGLTPSFASYFLYCLYHLIASPILATRSYLRAAKRGYKAIMWTRLLGGTKPPHDGEWTVICAGGLGEVRTGLTIAEQLWERTHGAVAVCTQAANAATLTHTVIPTGVLPFNNPISCLIFLRRWRPVALFSVEFMDNHHLKALCALLNIPVVIINVPITERTAGTINFLNRWRYNLIHAFCCQGPEFVDRLARAGLSPSRLFDTGPLALRVDPCAGRDIRPEELRSEWSLKLGLTNEHFPVIVAGSTYESDETVVLDAFKLVKNVYPSAVLILAPRMLNRPNGPSSVLVQKQAAFDSLTQISPEGMKTSILLVDTIGHLRTLYSVGHLAFIGGTLKLEGTGHTPVEAMAWYLPLTLGPHYSQQKIVIDWLMRENVATICSDAESLASSWIQCAKDPLLREQLAKKLSSLLENQDEAIIALFASLTKSTEQELN